MYSMAYQTGQRLSSYRTALDKAESDAAKYDGSHFYRQLGTVHYTAGFLDGWHGKVPRRQLRLADTVL